MIRYPNDIYAGSWKQIKFQLGQRKLTAKHNKAVGKQKGIKSFKLVELDIIE